MIVSVQGIIEYNAFSPNGDNINDNFSFENYGISDLNAVFYNRWGDKIYEMNSPSDTWNGVSMNGLEVPEGVYFYVLNATGEDGTPYSEKGSVTIYRWFIVDTFNILAQFYEIPVIIYSLFICFYWR